jgi:hypothetical protein
MTDIDAVKKNNVNPNAAGGSPMFTFDSDLMEEIVAITEEILYTIVGYPTSFPGNPKNDRAIDIIILWLFSPVL